MYASEDMQNDDDIVLAAIHQDTPPLSSSELIFSLQMSCAQPGAPASPAVAATAVHDLCGSIVHLPGTCRT